MGLNFTVIAGVCKAPGNYILIEAHHHHHRVLVIIQLYDIHMLVSLSPFPSVRLLRSISSQTTMTLMLPLETSSPCLLWEMMEMENLPTAQAINCRTARTRDMGRAWGQLEPSPFRMRSPVPQLVPFLAFPPPAILH